MSLFSGICLIIFAKNENWTILFQCFPAYSRILQTQKKKHCVNVWDWRRYTMYNHFPFWYRVVLLLGLMLVVALLDFYRQGAQATKFREYGFLVITGVIGGVFGLINDLITSSISPDYFIFGKGLDVGPNLRVRAGLLGLQVGFSAGVIGGAICLYVCRRKSIYPPITCSRLLRILWMPITSAVICGIALPLAFSQFDPAHFSTELSSLLDGGKLNRFRQVWWTHVGLYVGMTIGLVAMILRATKERKTSGKGS